MEHFRLGKQHLDKLPLLKRNEQLYTMATAAVRGGEVFLKAFRTEQASTIPFSAEEKAAKIISAYNPDAVVTGKQYQEKSDITSGTYYVIHGVNGFANYRHGREDWDVSIAFVDNGEIQSGVVYVPYFDRLGYAALGEGTYLNGSRLKQPPKRPLRESLIEVAPLSDWGRSDPREVRAVSALRKGIDALKDEYGIRFIETQSGGKNFLELAQGKIDGYASSLTGKGNLPAGVLLARELGLKATDIEGRNWQPCNMGVIAGATDMHEILLEVFQRSY